MIQSDVFGRIGLFQGLVLKEGLQLPWMVFGFEEYL